MELILLPVLFILVIPILAAMGIAHGARRIRTKRRGGRVFVSVGVFVLLMDAWGVASGIAEMNRVSTFWECQENLGRKLFPEIMTTAAEHPGEDWTKYWKPVPPYLNCQGAGDPTPYFVFSVASDPHGGFDARSILASCPHTHRHHWWVIWPIFEDMDYARLYGDGHTELIQEIEITRLK